MSSNGRGWKGCIKTTQPNSRNAFHPVTLPKAPSKLTLSVSTAGAPPAPAAAPWGPWHAPEVLWGADTVPPLQRPRGGCALIPRAAARPRPAPLVVLRGNRKSSEEHRAPLLQGLRRTAPANGESRLLLPAWHRARGPRRPPLGSALTSRGCPCACVAPLAVLSPAGLGCPGRDLWRDQVMDGARTQPELGFAQAGGTGRAAQPRSTGKDLDPLGSLLTAAFHGFPLHAPLPGPRPSFPSGSCPYWSLNSITPTPPPALGLQPAPDLSQPCSSPSTAPRRHLFAAGYDAGV